MQDKVVAIVGATGGIGSAEAIRVALSCEPQAVPMEINIQPESHLFF